MSSQFEVRFRDVFSTTSSSVIPLASPFIMQRCMPGKAYCPIPSSIWVTVETLMLRSLWLGLSDPLVSGDTYLALCLIETLRYRFHDLDMAW
jgi:hypothetical protein